MEVGDSAEGIQYVTTESEQQIYIQQGNDAPVAGQSLLQGKDGWIFLTVLVYLP